MDGADLYPKSKLFAEKRYSAVLCFTLLQEGSNVKEQIPLGHQSKDNLCVGRTDTAKVFNYLRQTSNTVA